MSKSWPKVRLGEVLERRMPDTQVTKDGEYQFAGVYCFGRGVFRSQLRQGTEFAYSVLTKLRAGEFIYPKLMAWEGAFGLVPESCDGCYVSPEFPVFEINRDRLEPKFLDWMFKRPSTWQEIAGGSTGTNVRRQRLNPSDFLSKEVNLPNLTKQKSIVTQISKWHGLITEAIGLKNSACSQTNSFWKVLSRMARDTDFPEQTLDQIADFLDGMRIPLSENERSTRRGPYPYYGASGIIDSVDRYIFAEPLLLLSEDGANLINRRTPIAFVAAGKYWVNNHAHVLRPREGKVDLRFLEYALKDYDVSAFNFASAQPKLNQRYAKQICFPVPPISEQLRIVAELDALQAQVDDLKRHQAETAAELDALLPAILDKAFKGQL